MATITSAQILTAWKERLVALQPLTRAGADDRYQVVIGVRHTYMGSRAVLLTCNPGRRVQGGRSCSDWEFQALVEVWYLDAPGGDAYLRACEDAEQIADDLYAWLASNDGESLGLLRVELELANIMGTEQELQVSRPVRFLYRGLE